jgi:hypothetical protein
MAKKSHDIILKDDFSLDIRNGDFFIDNSDDQHQQLIIRANTGNFLEFPLLGVGIQKYINGNLTEAQLNREIRIQLAGDGYNVKSILVDGSQITIEAERIR